MYILSYVYIYDQRHIHVTTKLLECIALHRKQLPVRRHTAHPGPIQLFPSIVGQSRQSLHMIISLTKHVANTRHWDDIHVCIPQKATEPRQVNERECNTDNYVHIVIANDNKTILMATQTKTVLKLNTRLYACIGKPKLRPR